MRDRGWPRLEPAGRLRTLRLATYPSTRREDPGAIRNLAPDAADRPHRRLRDGARGPDYGAPAKGADLGATWKTLDKDDGDLPMKPDDISFGEPVNAALVVIDGVHTLVWSRSAATAD